MQAVQRALPLERLSFELCRLWFDRIYVPGIRYLDGLKGNRSEEAVKQFEACFTEAERKALARFHHFLELRIDMLPNTIRERHVFPLNDTWQHIVKDASYLLGELATDPETLRIEVARVVEEALDRNQSPVAWLSIL